MNSVELKSDLHNLIDRVDDVAILNTIKSILNKQVSIVDYWDELPVNVQKSALRGMEQVKKGQTKAHDQVMKKYDKWLSK
jgi:predicted transcriptional regulator